MFSPFLFVGLLIFRGCYCCVSAGRTAAIAPGLLIHNFMSLGFRPARAWWRFIMKNSFCTPVRCITSPGAFVLGGEIKTQHSDGRTKRATSSLLPAARAQQSHRSTEYGARILHLMQTNGMYIFRTFSSFVPSVSLVFFCPMFSYLFPHFLNVVSVSSG